MEQKNYLPIGYKLRDYKIEGILGSGGFGVTYLAKHIKLETQVAIKEFLPQELSRREDETLAIMPFTNAQDSGGYNYHLRKFLQEAKILASIKHPNIVRVFDFFEANNTAYFVMDFIEGESLKSYIERKGSLNEEEIISIIIPILEGLKEVHHKKYLHRDIAPDNIYLRANGMPMLIDFGAAKNAGKNESTSIAAIVKKGYSPPEQYSLDSNHTPAIDIYAMGSVIYTMISGKTAPESIQRQLAILNDNPDKLEDVVQNYSNKYSKNLLLTIVKAMEIKVSNRFQNVGDMQRSLFDNDVGSNPKPPTEPPKPKTKKNILIRIFLELFVISKKKEDNGTAVAIYWGIFSSIIIIASIIIAEKVLNMRYNSELGSGIGAFISMLIGLYLISSRKKRMKGFSVFLFWFLFSCLIIILSNVLSFVILDINGWNRSSIAWEEYYEHLQIYNHGAMIGGIVISILIGVITFVKRRKTKKEK